VTLRTAFLNFSAFFLQTHLGYPFAYFLAALPTLFLTGVEVFGSRKTPAGEFLAKIIENPDFFRGCVTFSQFSALITHVWHPNNGLALGYEVLVAFIFYPIVF